MSRPVVEAEGLTKHYGEIRALDGIDLQVPSGTVLGLLGPNGAGKTTAVRILTTLLRPDRGWARVAGFDVVREAAQLREVIGLAGQYAAVDEHLTGRENLVLVGRLYHLGGRQAGVRAAELLRRFDLEAAADRPAKTYSGGMRRRLDLAASLVARPAVLFLDEPTTGLDPRSRIELWGTIRELVEEGTTLLLTTQYLEEADELADRIVLIDNGNVIAEGTSSELKALVGGEVVSLRLADPAHLDRTRGALESLAAGAIDVQADSVTLTMPLDGGAKMLPEVVRRVDGVGTVLTDLSLRGPSLDDVFLALTGHRAEEMPAVETPQGARP